MSSTTVRVTVNPKLAVNDGGSVATGFSTPFNAQFPVDGADIVFANGTGAKQINAKAFIPLTLVASTPQTIDLTAISGGYGDTVFAKVKIVGFYNACPAAVIVGAAVSTAFTGPLGGTAPTFTIPAGQYEVWTNGDANGWTVDSTHKNIKVDPGSGAGAFYIVVAGN